MATQSVKSHTRVSKNGTAHRVRAHQRATTFTEYVRESFNRSGSKEGRRNARYAALGIGATAIGWVVLQTVMTVTTSLLTILALLCLTIISLAFTGKKAKAGKWFPTFGARWRGPLSPRRRMKHAAHSTVKRMKRKVVPRWLHS